MQIRILKFITAALLTFSSCSLLSRHETVKLVINPLNHGWYFVEVATDSAGGRHNDDVGIDSIMQLEKMTVKNIQTCEFELRDADGNDLSGNMRLSGLAYRGGGRTFLQFYYPTPEELQTIHKWGPGGPQYQRIVNKGYLQLDMLTGSNDAIH